MREYDVQIEGYIRVMAESEDEARDKVSMELPSVWIGDTPVDFEACIADPVQA